VGRADRSLVVTGQVHLARALFVPVLRELEGQGAGLAGLRSPLGGISAWRLFVLLDQPSPLAGFRHLAVGVVGG
jgi:hypothetical protein